MKIAEEIITLNDGRTLTLRSAEEKDAVTMLDYIRKTAEETHYLIRYPEEISIDLEREKEIIRNNLESEDAAWFTIFDGEKAVGNCSISRHRNHLKLMHRCDFAIAIEQAYCNSGLGTILTQKAITKAREMGLNRWSLELMLTMKEPLLYIRRWGSKNVAEHKRRSNLRMEHTLMK